MPIEPSPASKSQNLIASILFAIPHLLATLLVTEYCRLVVTGFLNYFEQHDTPLPAITVQYHRFALAVADVPKGLVFATVLIDVILIFGLLSLPKGLRWISPIWVFGYLIVIMLFLYFGGVAMGLPLFPIDMKN